MRTRSKPPNTPQSERGRPPRYTCRCSHTDFRRSLRAWHQTNARLAGFHDRHARTRSYQSTHPLSPSPPLFSLTVASPARETERKDSRAGPSPKSDNREAAVPELRLRASYARLLRGILERKKKKKRRNNRSENRREEETSSRHSNRLPQRTSILT